MSETPTFDDLIMPFEGPTTDAAGRACLGVWGEQGGHLLTMRREKGGVISIGTNHGEHVTIAKFRLQRIRDFLAEGESLTGYQPPWGTCDWGECDEPATEWRWSEADLIHLPVCEAHELETELRALRESHADLVKALKTWAGLFGEACGECDACVMEDGECVHWPLIQSTAAALEKAEAING